VAELEQAYRQAVEAVPPGIIETLLVRDAQNPSLFRIVTVWLSRAALDAMRASGVKPKGIQMFEAVGAAPKLTILDVVVRKSGDLARVARALDHRRRAALHVPVHVSVREPGETRSLSFAVLANDAPQLGHSSAKSD